MSRFFTKRLSQLDPYIPGEQPQGGRIIKLNTNENPYPPSPAVLAALDKAAIENLRLYNDPDCLRFRQVAAEHFGLTENQVMIGNGSDENLVFALRAFCDEQTPLAFPDITYGFYPVWAKLLCAPAKPIPLKSDFTIDPTDYHNLNCTIVIANPNAPTGLVLSRADIEGILQTNPNNVVIIDEAYIDFGGESCVPLIDRYDNLIVVQTYSKSRNLAGARIGLTLACETLVADVNRVRNSVNPYDINSLSQLAGIAALQDTAYTAECVRRIADTRTATTAALRELGFEVTDSNTNFIFAQTDAMPGKQIFDALRSRGFIVRRWDNPRIANWLRISVGTDEEMQLLVQAITAIVKGETA